MKQEDMEEDQDMEAEEEESEEEEEDDDDEDNVSRRRSSGGGNKAKRGGRGGIGRGGSQGGRGGGRRSQGDSEAGTSRPGPKVKFHKRVNVRSGVTWDADQMVQNCIYYFLVRQDKKIPIKKADLVKHAMNGQLKDFPEVFKTLKFIFEDIFGIRIIQLEHEEMKDKAKASRAPPMFIMVSKFDCSVTERVNIVNIKGQTRRAVLFLILCVTFMLNRAIDEDMVWNIMHKLEFDKLICKNKHDLGKFLKTEYVAPMYLRMEETMEKEVPVTRYSWGQRSHLEFSTYGILKFVAEYSRKTPADFPIQYNTVMETDKEAVEADLRAMARSRNQNPDGENGSALDNTEQFITDSQALQSTGDSQS
jgi:hypothetical protein